MNAGDSLNRVGMRMLLRYTALLGIILLVAGFGKEVAGQQPSFNASGPKVVAVGEQFQLSWELNSNGENFQPPSLEGFMKIQGPSIGSSSSVSNINGKMERVDKYTYSYILAGKTEGVFEIQPASIVVKGRKISSNSLKIEVVKGQSGLRNNNAAQSSGNPTGVADDDVYVRVELSKTEAFMGEQIVATLKIYSRTNQIQFTDAKFPQFDGFVSSEVSDVPNTLQRENVNNEVVYTGVFKKLILIPQRTGQLSIDPFELSCNVNVQDGYGRDFFGRTVPRFKTMSLQLKSKPRSISVKALPGSQPADFTGAVGQFEFSASLDKNQVKTNDAISLKIKVSGKGNIKLVEALKINFPSDFDSFDPKVSENIAVDDRGSSGTKTFEYLLIPRYAGDFTIPSVSFSYFDINSGRYQTKTSEFFQIHVEKGEGDSQSAVVSGSISKKDVQLLGKDIRFLKDDLGLTKKGDYFFGSGSFWLMLILLPLLLFIALILKSRYDKDSSDVMKMKNKRATAKALKRLKDAELALKQSDDKRFFEALLLSLYGFFSDKLLIPVAELNRDSLNSKLNSQGIEAQIIQEMNQLLDTCEYSRYAPSGGKEEIQKHFDQAVKLIQQLDRQIKSKS